MFKRNLVSVSIVSVLLTSSMLASANTGSSEDEDSVNSWGQWAQNYATAAGGEFNTGALAFASLGQAETGRNGQNEPGVESGSLSCEAGALCGYASFYNFSGGESSQNLGISESDALSGYGINSKKPITAKFYADGGEGGVEFVVTPKNGQVAVNSLLLDSDVDGTILYSILPERLDAIVGATLECADPSRCSDDLGKGVYVVAQDDESAVYHGVWFNGEEISPGNYNVNIGGFVFGQVSTLADLDVLKENIAFYQPRKFVLPGDDFAQMGGALMANYSGHTTLGAPVNIQVNFTDNTWGGVFNGGTDSSVLAYQSSDGVSVAGHVGFSVEGGVIDGVNLIAGSDALSAGDALGAVTGSVNASFFGADASHVAGVAEIVKTTELYENATHVAAFDTTHQFMEN